MRPLSLLDAAFVHLESDETPMHVGAVFVLRAPAGGAAAFTARLRRRLRARLGASPVFTRRLVEPPLRFANPLWAEAGDVDLGLHVQRHTVARPGGHRELDDAIAALHERRLDRTRPLWELHVLDGLARGRLALYLKVHHAGFDGASAQAFVRCFTDAESRPARPRPRHAPPEERASGLDALGAALAHQWQESAKLADRVRAAMSRRERNREAAPFAGAAPRTPLNGSITRARSFASIDVPFAGVRAFAHAHGVTINDVVLAAAGGALRRWLRERDALPARSLLAAVPVSLRVAGDESHEARVSFATCSLHTDARTPASRLARIAAETRRAKRGDAAGALPLPGDLPSIGWPWVLGGIVRLLGRREIGGRVPVPWNVLVSNVVGPPVPLYVLGTRVLTYTPVSIPFHGLALNVTVYSYDGRLYFGITAARDAVPDTGELAQFVVEEWRTLLRTAPRPGARSPRGARVRAKRAA
jgi:WS/DGAT/MGAT family acyltransferase